MSSTGKKWMTDLSNKKFGRLTVMSFVERKGRRYLWNCYCECGNDVCVAGANLVSGKTKSCGCIRSEVSSSKFIDITNQTFGRLTVLKRIDNSYWLCRCECGTLKHIIGAQLRSGKTQSCGCLPAYNRLDDLEAAFNVVLSGYKKNCIRRSGTRYIPWELTNDEFRSLINQRCYYCGAEPTNTAMSHKNSGVLYYNGIDRVDSSRGYVSDNVVPCCKLCNRFKNDLTVDYFLAHVARISEHQYNLMV